MIADQSAIGCQRITSTTSRRPPTTTFLGVFFGGFRWPANDCRWSPTSRRLVVRTVWSARGIRCSIENQTSRRNLCKHSLVGDRSPINRRSVADQSSVVAHHFFLVSNNKPATKEYIAKCRTKAATLQWPFVYWPHLLARRHKTGNHRCKLHSVVLFFSTKQHAEGGLEEG